MQEFQPCVSGKRKEGGSREEGSDRITGRVEEVKRETLKLGGKEGKWIRS